MSTAIVVGIDGGGTYTRAIASDMTGRVLAYSQTGGSNPDKALDAESNVKRLIREVVANASCELQDVIGLVAGLAGLDSAEDEVWAERFTDVPGLTCPRVQVNDAVVAHAGAFALQPGIVAIAGTGCLVFGITEVGRMVRNYDFHHYAPAAARYLSYEAVHQLLAGMVSPADAPFVDKTLAYWTVADVASLRELGVSGFCVDELERKRRFGNMAPVVTAAAQRGIPLACRVCDQAAEALTKGIRLVGNCFERDCVRVAFIGGVAQDTYMRHALARALDRSEDRHYVLVEPILSNVAGAILLALKNSSITVDESVIVNLRAFDPQHLDTLL